MSTTLLELLERPELRATRVCAFPGEDTRTLSELWAEAERIAAGLQQRGVGPGTVVGVLLPNSLELLAVDLAVLRAGAALAPLAFPSGKSVEAAAGRFQGTLAAGGIRHVVSSPELAALASGAPLELDVLTASGLRQAAVLFRPIAVAPSDLALVQFTSGSTGHPRGVALTHAQAAAGVEATRIAGRVTRDDRYCMWLPLSHDMGLMSTLCHLSAGADVHVSSPSFFIKQPDAWLEHFARVQATIYAGPNFSYQYLVDAVGPEAVARLDLSRWRLALNGAETIDPGLMLRFMTHFAPAGFRPETMYPVYGLAEATVAVTFPEPGELPLVDWVDRSLLGNRGEAKVVARDDPRSRGIVCVGRPVPGIQVRIVAPAHGELRPDRQVGEIEVKGDSVMSGYYRDVEGTAGAFRDGWLRTGDLGYLSGGRLFVSGRIKELLKLRGENHFPEELEALVRNLDGVNRHRAVALGVLADGGERIAVLLETELADTDARAALGQQAKRLLVERLGEGDVDVYLVEPRAIERTTSGKYQRLVMGEQIRSGSMGVLGVY